ncbi:hypothetical protein [Acinetobacter seifertii]|uniref:hypothetical protein n=1 Tax=Acinetobacter seifertii TaxID=1530123 RepID=UPI0032B62447
MSYLKQRFEKNTAQIIRHRNSFIPQLEALDEPLNYVSKHFKSYLIADYEINKITVIDPYMAVVDLQRLSMLFGGDAKNKLEIITKFEAYKREEATKNITIETIVTGKDRLVSNGLFNQIIIYHSNKPMHDRYFIFWKEDIIHSIFSIGGSLNQQFGCFIQIQEISDTYLQDSVIHYYQMLKDNLEAEY